MSYYDWPNILKKYSVNELKKVVNDKNVEQDEKVSAAFVELNKRGIIFKDNSQLEDENFQFIINDLSTCYYCKSKGLKETDKFCPVCAFPQGGTKTEMRTYILNIKKKEQLLEKKKAAIHKARILLYALAALNLIVGLVLGLFVSINIPVLIGCGIGTLIYLLLGAWSESQPFPAILSGFFIYIFFIVINAVIDPNTIYQGFVWKVIIITGFIYGFNGVKDAKKIEAEFVLIKKAKDLNI